MQIYHLVSWTKSEDDNAVQMRYTGFHLWLAKQSLVFFNTLIPKNDSPLSSLDYFHREKKKFVKQKLPSDESSHFLQQIRKAQI